MIEMLFRIMNSTNKYSHHIIRLNNQWYCHSSGIQGLFGIMSLEERYVSDACRWLSGEEQLLLFGEISYR